MMADRSNNLGGTEQARDSDFEAFMTEQPISEAFLIPLGRGCFSVDVGLMRTRNTILLRNQISARSTATLVPDREWLSILVPLSWQGELRYNGQLATETTIFVNGGFDGYTTQASKRDVFGVGVRRKDFVSTLAALTGVAPEDYKLHSGALVLPKASANRLKIALLECLRRSAATPAQNDLDDARFTEVIYTALLEAYLSGDAVSEEQKTRMLSNRQIVRRAEERFNERIGHTISLADLCSSVGVGKTVLYRAFHDVCGVSPLTFLHRRRLMKAHSNLTAASSADTQVKEVALSVGLTHLGRFSVEYRSLFGESPSVTLRAG